MPSYGMLGRVDLLRKDVSEERSAVFSYFAEPFHPMIETLGSSVTSVLTRATRR
jgi:hypothetical protein